MKYSFRLVIGIGVAWLAIAALGALELWPYLGSWREAALFVAFFPPFYMLAEGVNSWLFSPAHGKAVSSKSFSFLRVLIALPIVAAWLWLSWLLVAVIPNR